jgi:6-phosphofructokinase 1
MQLGGTMLGSTRCPEFRTEEPAGSGAPRAGPARHRRGRRHRGNGSQAGAHELSKMGFPVVGVASTSTMNLLRVGNHDRCERRSTSRWGDRSPQGLASSHQRAFLVEVMGRECGYLALMVGIAGGAEMSVIPEEEVDPEEIASTVRAAYQRGKAHALVVVAEGAKHNASQLASYFARHRDRLGFEIRATTLGHVQRGGAPGAFDRLLATRLGAAATDRLERGEHGILCGLLKGEMGATPLAEVVSTKKALETSLLELARVLAQ